MTCIPSLTLAIAQTKGGIDSQTFNSALAKLQALLGVESGDNASHFFATYSDTWETLATPSRIHIIREYIHLELMDVLTII